MQKQQAVADKKVAEEAEKAALAMAQAVCTKCTELETLVETLKQQHANLHAQMLAEVQAQEHKSATF